MTREEFEALCEAQTVIVIMNGVKSNETYAEPGMYARLVRLDKVDNDGSLSFLVDFTGFAEMNERLETTDWWGKDGVLQTARETGNYKDVDSLWVDSFADLDGMFRVADPSMSMLHSHYQDEKRPDEKFVEWLTSQVTPLKGSISLDTAKLEMDDSVSQDDAIRAGISLVRLMNCYIELVHQGREVTVFRNMKMSDVRAEFSPAVVTP